MRFFPSAAAVLMVGIAVAGGAHAADSAPESECHLRSTYNDWPPYQETRDGRAAGLDVEMMRAIMKEAGCTVTFMETSGARSIKLVARGAADISPGVTPRPEREAHGYNTLGYRLESVGLLVRKGDEAMLSLESLPAMIAEGKRIGVSRGYYYGPEVKALQQDPDTAGAFDESTAAETDLRKLVHGRVDAVLTDPLVGLELVQRLGLSDQLALHPTMVFQSPVVLWLSKASQSPEMVERLNAAIRKLQDEGALGGIETTYFESYQK